MTDTDDTARAVSEAATRAVRTAAFNLTMEDLALVRISRPRGTWAFTSTARKLWERLEIERRAADHD